MSDQATPQPQKRAGELPDRVLEIHAAAMRESFEPRDGIRPTPVAYLILCFFFTMWGGFYLAKYGGDWTADGLAEQSGSKSAQVPVVAQDPMKLGAEVYGACIQCHQTTGLGIAGSFPPLANSEFVTGDDHRLAAILLNGIEGPLTVNGQPYNSQMPAWKENLNDEEIAAVLTYIRASFGNKAPPVAKATVEAMRKKHGAQGPWSASSLAAFER